MVRSLCPPLSATADLHSHAALLSKPTYAQAAGSPPDQAAAQQVKPVDLQRAKIDGINAEIAATKDVLHKNIEMITERGETLDHLDQRTHDLSIHAQTFKSQAQSTRRKFWWKNMKWTIAIGVLIVIIIGGIIGGAIKGSH
ncbi:hypothetical protein IAT38_002199 [Cryptococcus sp. DSM 104549]